MHKFFKYSKALVLQHPLLLIRMLSYRTTYPYPKLPYHLRLSQIESGAQILQIFESWAHQLSEEQFVQFAKPYADEVARYLTFDPVISPLVTLYGNPLCYIFMLFPYTLPSHVSVVVFLSSPFPFLSPPLISRSLPLQVSQDTSSYCTSGIFCQWRFRLFTSTTGHGR